MSGTVEFDAVAVSLVELVPPRPSGFNAGMPAGKWELRFIDARGGGVNATVDSLHLSDVLSDSGVEEPGDVAFLAGKPGFTSWKPSALAGAPGEVIEAETAELYLSVGAPGGQETSLALAVEGETPSGFLIHLGASSWISLCAQVAGAIGAPWFHSLQASVSPVRLPGGEGL